MCSSFFVLYNTMSSFAGSDHWPPNDRWSQLLAHAYLTFFCVSPLCVLHFSSSITRWAHSQGATIDRLMTVSLNCWRMRNKVTSYFFCVSPFLRPSFVVLHNMMSSFAGSDTGPSNDRWCVGACAIRPHSYFFLCFPFLWSFIFTPSVFSISYLIYSYFFAVNDLLFTSIFLSFLFSSNFQNIFYL